MIIITKKDIGLLNGDDSYTLYNGDVSIGSLCRLENGKWSLSLDCGIHCTGMYRYDVLEEGDMLYKEYLKRGYY
jgi:hypothetical protein